MAYGSNKVQTSAADPAARSDSSSGSTVDPGPYEATVLSHVVGSRSGQLRVFIRDFGEYRMVMKVF